MKKVLTNDAKSDKNQFSHLSSSDHIAATATSLKTVFSKLGLKNNKFRR